MPATLVDFANDSVIYNITGITKAELENKLNLFFTSQELPLKSDDGNEKAYQKGNKVMRVLFGVFVKYFRVTVSIKEQDGLFSVRLSSWPPAFSRRASSRPSGRALLRRDGPRAHPRPGSP